MGTAVAFTSPIQELLKETSKKLFFFSFPGKQQAGQARELFITVAVHPPQQITPTYI